MNIRDNIPPAFYVPENDAVLEMTTVTNPGSNVATSITNVDNYSGVIILLTAGGVAQTIQSPTDTTAGRVFTIVNDDTSTNSIVVNGFTITPGEAQSFIWDGTAWGPTDMGITAIPVTIAQGGTGATTAALAKTALGAASLASPTFTGIVGAANITPTILAIAEKTPVNAVAAQGTITMAGVATAEETFAVNAQTFTWKAARAAAGEVTVGANAAGAVTNIVDAITADLATVTAVDGAGDTVVLTAATKGTAGNSIVLTEASTNMTVDGTGTLGATTAGVDGTVGVANETCADASFLYHCLAVNTVSGTNWRKIDLGAVY